MAIMGHSARAFGIGHRLHELIPLWDINLNHALVEDVLTISHMIYHITSLQVQRPSITCFFFNLPE